MLFDIELHMAAGIGALLLGIGALASGPGRKRNRFFALLCGSIAIWMLGVALSTLAREFPGRIDFPWHVAYLFGSCSAVPLGLHFFSRLIRFEKAHFRTLLWVSYGMAAVLWGTSWTTLHDRQPQWNLAAMIVLGAILIFGSLPLWRHVLSLDPGIERVVSRLFLRGALVAVVGGLSDFLPRGGAPVPKIGPAAVLIFLLIVSTIIIRHRFLNVATFLARTVALVAGAFVASLLLYGVARFSGARLFPLFLATLIVLALVRPAGRLLIAGTRALFRSDNPLTTAFQTLSEKLPLARDRKALVTALEEARRLLPGDIQMGVYVRGRDGHSFRLAYRHGMESLPATLPEGSALPRVVESEHTLVTLRFLEDESREARGARKKLAATALEECDRLDVQLIIPVFYGGRLGAWGVLGSDLPEDYITIDVATTFRAVASQAMESLQRVEAIEDARRREALVAVGEMAAGLAHEVRNPVGAIRGAAEVIADENDPKRVAEMMQVIQEESDRLGRVVGEFLGYARPVSPNMKGVDLAEIAREAVRAAEMAGMGLHVRVLTVPDTPPALGDPDQLQRAFRNLVWNARESAGAEGHLWVEVSRAGPGQVAIRFEDDGPGIPSEMQPRLFQPFQSTKAGGTGLGLALVHRVVEGHGGRISVGERSGGGASFTLLLPAKEVAV